MWNEPTYSHYFNGSAAQYATNVLIPGYNAVKATDAAIQVIIGPASVDTTWLQSLLNAGGKGHFDIASFHDYGGSASSAINQAKTLQNFLNQNGIGAIPIWLGEYGYQENTTNDTTQQAIITGVLTGSNPIAMAQWYNLRDDDPSGAPGNVCKHEYFGLVQHDDMTRKNGYATMQSLLGGTGSGGTTTVDDSVMGNGQNQFNYSGSNWTHCTSGCMAGSYNNTVSLDDISGEYATISFTGTQIKFYTDQRNNRGIAGVSIDGGSETNVDLYAATDAADHLIWTSPMLSRGAHTLKIRNTGMKNSQSSVTRLAIDRVDILP